MFEGNESKDRAELMDAIDNMGQEAPCENFPDAFFSEYGDLDYRYTVEVAKSLCKECPVRALCGNFGMRWEEFGIWGGMTPLERKRLRRLYGMPTPKRRELDLDAETLSA